MPHLNRHWEPALTHTHTHVPPHQFQPSSQCIWWPCDALYNRCLFIRTESAGLRAKNLTCILWKKLLVQRAVPYRNVSLMFACLIIINTMISPRLGAASAVQRIRISEGTHHATRSRGDLVLKEPKQVVGDGTGKLLYHEWDQTHSHTHTQNPRRNEYVVCGFCAQTRRRWCCAALNFDQISIRIESQRLWWVFVCV